uniref:Uncharacterized protein n=1 Tax=Cacopsylla melanoneura TaxID=428564 RepID=A0A8D8RT13_9HEMI
MGALMMRAQLQTVKQGINALKTIHWSMISTYYWMPTSKCLSGKLLFEHLQSHIIQKIINESRTLSKAKWVGNKAEKQITKDGIITLANLGHPPSKPAIF